MKEASGAQALGSSRDAAAVTAAFLTPPGAGQAPASRSSPSFPFARAHPGQRTATGRNANTAGSRPKGLRRRTPSGPLTPAGGRPIRSPARAPRDAKSPGARADSGSRRRSGNANPLSSGNGSRRRLPPRPPTMPSRMMWALGNSGNRIRGRRATYLLIKTGISHNRPTTYPHGRVTEKSKLPFAARATVRETPVNPWDSRRIG